MKEMKTKTIREARENGRHEGDEEPNKIVNPPNQLRNSFPRIHKY